VSVKIIITSDGSHSILNETLNETYHSRHGAMQESIHVFIKNGLEFYGARKSTISILEIGFGTGLNAMLTLEYANRNGQAVHYTTIEPAPLQKDIWSNLNYSESLSLKAEFTKLHTSAWNEQQTISSNFEFLKISQTLQDVNLAWEVFDLIYYDAFAPSKQPSMWELSVLDKVGKSMKPGGALVTYCAKGALKRDLRSLGLHVEMLCGPPGKREMIRAIKL
jgi:tRNA U34 5-methylaminomethyl-2-thiouridine-forming methyltransferase MnmC